MCVQLLSNADQKVSKKLQEDEKPVTDLDQLGRFDARTVSRYYLQAHASHWGGPVVHHDFMPMPAQVRGASSLSLPASPKLNGAEPCPNAAAPHRCAC